MHMGVGKERNRSRGKKSKPHFDLPEMFHLIRVCKVDEVPRKEKINRVI
jgi:hypothetical protein